ncbi:unnamed protein product [Bursaphelenchus okinawaensis]|uniref:Flavin-containing monooxygenase n=1 Tax=Bursaphelenchus okinawaensis TaxID=465554 RepID=A0A811LNB2_9BILA|nr:unnamed protein product [Bursaphelenchus okinawaensis]CAG9125291.1 unnamed protein product [Bursaphelenchus okinawaensis]
MKKVLVVGAGASGLPALKTALEYGFDARCFERSDQIGGLWRYKENPLNDEGTVMKSTVINTSKEMTAYSDFPPLDDAPNYMHNSEMYSYLHRYADHFKLRSKVFFKHQVLSIQRAKCFSENGQWKVKYEIMDTNEILEETFDGIMMCTGHHSIPYIPDPFPGQNLFKGEVLHSKKYRTCKGFEDKVVVVVGIGNSGGDIAVELSKVAKKVYLSTRSGSWIMNRVWDYGEPSDLALLNRFTFWAKGLAPQWLQNTVMESKVNRRFDHGRFGVKPNHRFLQAHVTVNDELPNRLISGTVVIKPNISKFTESGVIFEDNTVVENVDTVILATGYSFNFDLIEDGRLIKVENNRVLLYQLMFPPQLAPNNSLAIIGLIQPTGSIMPISEMQCRVFCAQLAGKAKLPSQMKMTESALKMNIDNCRRFIDRRRHTLQVYYVNYMDSLAKLINVKPKIVKALLTDPRLAKHLIFHGLVPYQYRLNGQHSWPEARKNIIEFDKRVFNCTRTRLTKETAKAKPKGRWDLFRLVL